MMTDEDETAPKQLNRGMEEGTVTPPGWRPTRDKPVPVVRCTAIRKDGERCRRWSLRGTTVCLQHGGRLPRVQDHATAVVESARLRLIDMADGAVDQIEDLMLNGTAEKIRLDASREVLNRAGINGPVEIDVQVTHNESPADRARKKLEDTASKLAAQLSSREKDEDVVDAEVEDDEISENEEKDES